MRSSLRRAVLLFALLAARAGGKSGAAAAGEPPAPFTYDQVVEPLPRPTWLDRVFMFCMPYETPYQGAAPELKPWAARLRERGFVLLGMYPDSFCRLYRPASKDEEWSEACRAEVERMHSLGLKVLAGVYPFVGSRGPRDLLDAHPEWRLRADEAVPPAPGNGCLINPGFAAALRDLLVERAREYRIDGYQFDGWYQCAYCVCPGCRDLYREETGKAIPPRDPKDREYRRYVAWRDGKLLENAKRLREAVKAVNPDFALVNWNNNDAHGAAPSWMPESLNAVFDWTNKEWWAAENVESVWLAKRLRGSSGDERPPGIQPYLFMRGGKDIESGLYHGSSAPMEEIRYRLHLILSMGSVPILWSGARAGWRNEDWAGVVRAAEDFLPLVEGTTSLKYAVAIDSYSTLQSARARRRPDAGGGADPEALVGQHRGGLARALLEEHLPFDVISEHNVTPEVLARYRVVILPDHSCLPDRIADALRAYVLSGGGLVATFETSLHDQWGEKRKDFALADLFGANWLGSAPVGPGRIGFSAERHPVGDDPALRDLLGARGEATWWGRFARVKVAAGAAAPFRGIDVKSEKDPAKAAWTPLLLSERGRGRVAYFPAAIDQAYFDAGYPYQRRILAGALRWAAGAGPPVAVRAPRCVLAGFFVMEQAGSRRVIVHLLNGINSTAGHGSKDDQEFGFREEVVEVPGVKVSLAGSRPERVLLVPGGATLEPIERADGWEVSLPPLGIHAAVVAEYRR